MKYYRCSDCNQPVILHPGDVRRDDLHGVKSKMNQQIVGMYVHTQGQGPNELPIPYYWTSASCQKECELPWTSTKKAFSIPLLLPGAMVPYLNEEEQKKMQLVGKRWTEVYPGELKNRIESMKRLQGTRKCPNVFSSTTYSEIDISYCLRRCASWLRRFIHAVLVPIANRVDSFSVESANGLYVDLFPDNLVRYKIVDLEDVYFVGERLLYTRSGAYYALRYGKQEGKWRIEQPLPAHLNMLPEEKWGVIWKSIPTVEHVIDKVLCPWLSRDHFLRFEIEIKSPPDSPPPKEVVFPFEDDKLVFSWNGPGSTVRRQKYVFDLGIHKVKAKRKQI